MATVNLGSIKFKWKGTYAGGTAYTIDDVVSYNGSSYICILASTGNLPTNATYFEQMSSAGTNGTNGTDLTTTLTTQGDLVYRDGSGLQRLGAGTAGQVLQTGGAGANPSWGTVSSDYVKITSGSFTAVSEITFNTSNFDGATYDSFDIVIRLKHASGSNAAGATFIQFSTDNLSSFFSSNISGNTSTFNSASTAHTVHNHDNTDRNQISRDGNRNTFGTYILTWVGLNKATEKQCFSQAIKANHDAITRVCSETAYTHINSTTSTNNAFKLIWSGGSNHSYTGTYIIYGRKS